MNSIVTGAKFKPFLKPALAALMVAGAWATAAQAAPTLNFSSYSQVWGYIQTSYSSQYVGDVSFTLNGKSDSQYSAPNSLNTLATASYSILPNMTPVSDPVYDLVTDHGAYGFSYSGTAKTGGTGLHAGITTSQIDATGQPVISTTNSSLYAYSQASWSQALYVAPTAQHAAGTYGAILVGFTMDGSFSSAADGYNYASMEMRSNFSDTAGVSYQSSAGIYASSDSGWTGSQTTFKKLLFQYGTTFDLTSYLVTYSSGNGNVDFLNTGKISSIEVPFGATLESGAEQAGLGTPASLYGVVFNSATLDDPNTNWDFGNNGGGFTPNVPVPEPGTWALLAGGLALLFVARRRALR